MSFSDVVFKILKSIENYFKIIKTLFFKLYLNFYIH